MTGSESTNENARGQAGIFGTQETNQQLKLCDFPSQKVNPQFPDMRFLPGRVLGILLSGRHYTHRDSWIELGHARLADSVWKLRTQFGWPVKMIEEVVPTSDGARSATIGRYYLDSEVIQAAGERGQRYAAECARIEAERRRAA